MNLDDLTLGQAKELVSLFGNKEQLIQPIKSKILNSSIGKYVIVRTRNEGINFGKVIDADETGVILDEARRIHHHKPKDNNVSWYEGVAETGLHKDSKISGEVSRKYIIEDYSLTVCSEKATKNIKSYEATKS